MLSIDIYNQLIGNRLGSGSGRFLVGVEVGIFIMRFVFFSIYKISYAVLVGQRVYPLLNYSSVEPLVLPTQLFTLDAVEQFS